jgi:sugar phosphate isomerase/epimerase
MTRRRVLSTMVAGALGIANRSSGRASHPEKSGRFIRLGGPVFKDNCEPEEWVRAHQELGYTAAYCPLNADASAELIQSFENAARKANLTLAEVGAWSNPVSTDDEKRKQALAYCQTQLDLADRIGARCCVNIAGSRNPEQWDGPHPDNLSGDTFDLIVESVRRIIDAVKPKRSFYTLEPMPWIYPDSVESYLNLIKAIDRKAFAVHLDPVNMVNSPGRFFRNGDLIREMFNKLGPTIKSCHAKDITLMGGFPVHLQECRPGLGRLDYSVYLSALAELPDPPPLMLEHLEKPEEYRSAAEYIRSVAQKQALSI